MGGEFADHEAVKRLGLQPYLFKKNGKLQLVYAGALLPKAYEPLEQQFKAIAAYISVFENVEFHFIGTGKTPNDPLGYNVRPLAEQYGLWQKVVFEYPKRIPYLDVLAHLEASDGVFILGSTEPHYTPSKTYQGVLSGKPILAVLHKQSTAVQVLRESEAGVVLEFEGANDLQSVRTGWLAAWLQYREFHAAFKPEQVNRTFFEQYSARNITKQLVQLLNEVVDAKYTL
jgi:hypothetical protein